MVVSVLEFETSIERRRGIWSVWYWKPDSEEDDESELGRVQPTKSNDACLPNLWMYLRHRVEPETKQPRLPEGKPPPARLASDGELFACSPHDDYGETSDSLQLQ
ncbi:hypothetical protein MRX96_027067 [Rhipicephalus microplus]